MNVRCKVSSVLLLLATALTSANSWCQSQGGTVDQAKEVLAAMAKTYALCRTYQDQGKVQITFIEPKGNRIQEIHFSTAFVRPDRFRFEYRDWDFFKKQRCFIICEEGATVKAWWDVEPGVKTPKSLELALAGATGVSAGSAHTIPALLLPEEVGGKKLTDLREPSLAAEEEVAGEDCYVIKGHFLAKDKKVPTTVWISKKNHLVLQTERRTNFDDFSTIQVTTYTGRVDEDVSAESLAFNAPPKS
jgi:hypothetical protein